MQESSLIAILFFRVNKNKFLLDSCKISCFYFLFAYFFLQEHTKFRAVKNNFEKFELCDTINHAKDEAPCNHIKVASGHTTPRG